MVGCGSFSISGTYCNMWCDICGTKVDFEIDRKPDHQIVKIITDFCMGHANMHQERKETRETFSFASRHKYGG